MSYYKTPEHPFREALRALTGKEPPSFVQGHSDAGLTDAQKMQLQDWCSQNANPRWATGLSIYEAAEMIVSEAVGNANIEAAPKCNCRSASIGSTFCKTCGHDLGCPFHNAAPCRKTK